jgi:hypothetical protein
MPLGKFLSGKSAWKTAFSIPLFFISFLSFSQANYKKALVVTSQGDTLRGYINYREWNYNPEEFSFKSQPADGQSRLFTPQTARYVSLEGYEAYEAHRVAISLDEVAPSRLKEGPDTSKTVATVFLKLLLKGNLVNLYLYKDSQKERFYFLEKGAVTPEELGYKVYLVNTDIATSPIYRQQLSALAVRHQVFTLTQKIQAATYNRTHLMQIIGKLNGSTDTSIAKTLEKAPGIRWFGSAGVNYATFVYHGEDEIMIDKLSEHGFYLFKDQIITHSYLPRFSVGADAYLHPAVQRFVIRGELTVAPARSEVLTHFQHSNYSTTKPPQEQHNVYRLSLTTISAAPQVLVNAYNTDKLKWYLGAGSALNYRLVTRNKLHRQRTDEETVVEESENDNFYEMQKLGLTLILRSGLMLHKKMDLSLLYIPASRLNSKGTGRYGTSVVGTSSLQLSGGYFF